MFVSLSFLLSFQYCIGIVEEAVCIWAETDVCVESNFVIKWFSVNLSEEYTCIREEFCTGGSIFSGNEAFFSGLIKLLAGDGNIHSFSDLSELPMYNLSTAAELSGGNTYLSIIGVVGNIDEKCILVSLGEME